MDTIQYNTLIEKLNSIQVQLQGLESSKKMIEIYGPTIIGFLAILASLYIGYKQVQSNTINVIRLDTINKLRNTMLELYSDFEKYIRLKKIGASKSELEIVSNRINNNCVNITILIDSRDIKHRSFNSTLIKVQKGVINKTKSHSECLSFWQAEMKTLLNRFDSLVEQEIKKL